MRELILKKAELLYDYLNVPIEVLKADLIIGLGCMDKGIPMECVRLYEEGYGKLIVFSGNVGKGTEGVLKVTEAERFKEIAVEAGVPEDNILLEKQATNTYENYKYSKKLLEKTNVKYNSVIVVQKPYVKRRCVAIADVEFQNKRVYVTSQNLSFEKFVKQSEQNQTMDLEEIISEIVGEISIIIHAPKFGIQSSQKISDEVMGAYNFLLECGYTKHVITDEKIGAVVTKWKTLGLVK